ncbi:MAG: UDP-N-acetylmuramate--L-alanine ligase [bacterium]|nr:UDP-N-acetylmuramate--L-alanine ligase [bacterium]
MIISSKRAIFTVKNSRDNSIHFIGIGGIGVSSLARFYLAKGNRVTGSDLQRSALTDDLAKEGAHISIGKQKAENISPETTLVIYTAAIPSTHPELAEAQAKGIKTKTYAEGIGDLTKEYRTITISGSHGKSTTTALTALILEDGYCDPTVIVGTKLNEFGGSNFRSGKGAHLVLEADEWNKSFLNYHPEIAVVTNIDTEHLDTYGTPEEVDKTFAEYLEKVPRHGKIIANEDNERLRNVAKKFGMKVKWYSLKDPEAATVKSLLKIPGDHNVSNALAALNVGRQLGIAGSDILQAIGRFTGAWRRFEFMGMLKGAAVFNDYGHHPSEIKATLAAARDRFPFRRVICVYQPHQHQRLQYLWDDFVGAFDLADHTLLVPVYDVVGRETDMARKAVSSAKLVTQLKKRGKQAEHAGSFAAAKRWIKGKVKTGDVLLIMGAGDIDNLAREVTML